MTLTANRVVGAIVGRQLRSAVYDLRLQSDENATFVDLLEQLVGEC